MSIPTPDHLTPLPERDMRGAWRIVTAAGMVGIGYFSFCLLDVPRVRFLTELGATAFDFGLIASLGSFAVGFQLLAAVVANRVRRRKPLWISVVVLHRLLWMAVIAAPFAIAEPRDRIWWIIGVIFVHDCLLQFSSPVWLSWMGDLLPRSTMNQMWADRLSWVTGANIVTALIAALVMGLAEHRDSVIAGYVSLSLLGIVLGVVDALMFLKVPEPRHARDPDTGLLGAMLQPVRDREYRPFVWFMVVWHFTMMLAGPFFMVYMIESLKMPALYAQMATMMALLAVTLTSPFWGRVCDTYGNRPVLRITLVLKTFTILGFIFTPPIPHIYIPVLSAVLFFDGFVNAGIVLAMQGIMFQASPRRNRPMYIATINFLGAGLAGAVAPLISGKIIDSMTGMAWVLGPYRFNAYHLMFLVSGVTRFYAWWLAERVPTYRKVSTRATIRELLRSNPVSALWRIRMLEKSRDSATRARAARDLGHRRVVLALSSLIRALEDPDREVRANAAGALGLIGRDEATTALARALWDPASGIHSPAAKALGRIGGFESLRALLHNLRRPEARGVGPTIDALASMGDTSAILPLICLYDETTDAPMRSKIAAALSALSHASTEQEVMALFETQGRPGGSYDFV